MKKEKNIKKKTNPHIDPKTKNLFIILLIAATVVIGSLIFWFQLINQNAEKLIEERDMYQQELANTKSLSEIQAKLEKAKESRSFFDSLYVDGENALGFITFLESLANDSGVDLNIQSLNSSTENSEQSIDHEIISMSLNFRGEWTEVNNFILMIENLPYHVKVGNLKLTSVQNSESENSDWSASMNFEVVAK